MSKSNCKRITGIIKDESSFKNTTLEIKDISSKLNVKLRGWINYYSLFSRRSLHRLFSRLDHRLLEWIKKKFKIRTRKAQTKLNMIKREMPRLFYHWEKGIC